MKILKTYKTIDLIEITENDYCVRMSYKSFFGKTKHTFFCLNYSGTDFVHPSLFKPITVDTKSRAEYIFNCNAIILGALNEVS
jgi:hypothetical protein